MNWWIINLFVALGLLATTKLHIEFLKLAKPDILLHSSAKSASKEEAPKDGNDDQIAEANNNTNGKTTYIQSTFFKYSN